MAAGPSQIAAFQRALAALRTGRVNDAEKLLKEVLRADPRDVAALNLLAILLMQLGRFAEAETYLRRALQEQPKSDATLYNYGITLKALNRPAEALERFTQAAAINAAVAETWNNRGTVFNALKRYDEAIADFQKAIGLNPRYAEAFCNKANSYAALEQFDDAVAEYQRALELKSDLAEAWCGCGNAYWHLKRYEEASAAFDTALGLKSNLAEAWVGRGDASAELRRYDEAFTAYDKALALKPDLAEAWLGSGNVFTGLKRYDEAFTAYDKALALKPDLANAWLGRGNVFTELKRYDEAFSAYDKALALKPDLANAWLGRGSVFGELKRYDEAFAAYDKALALKPDLAEAWLGRGSVFVNLKHYDDAFAACEKALALKPDLDCAVSVRLHAKMHLCDWTNLKAEVAGLLSISRERVASPPFSLLAIPSSPSDQLQCTRRYVRDQPHFAPLWRGEIYSHDRVRVAYLSADFGEHPVAYLTVGLFEQHDKSQFEVTGISFGAHHSPIRQRLKSAFESFIEVDDKTDRDIAELIRRSEIDIAVDLMGHTVHNRFSVFARRPAPIQINYLGYLGTLGAKFIDYVIADKIALPFDQQQYFDEKIIHLPDCFVATDDRQEISSWYPSRQETGLPADGFVFCCFNNSYKLTRPLFEAWMRVLRAVPDSVLWLVQSNDKMIANLRGEAERCCVDSARLVFAPRLPLPQHLARQRLAGLFLDTVPYNAGATAVAALRSGVPVLTVRGETFVGRIAPSMLHAIGLSELVTHNLDDYEALAVKLAREPILLAGFRRRLEENQSRMPLFDTDRFRRHLEQAYRTMVETQRRAEPPHSFSVECAQAPAGGETPACA